MITVFLSHLAGGLEAWERGVLLLFYFPGWNDEFQLGISRIGGRLF